MVRGIHLGSWHARRGGRHCSAFLVRTVRVAFVSLTPFLAVVAVALLLPGAARLQGA